MAGLDTLTITNSGLFSINQKIANSRTYSSSLITVVGSPAISDGIASGLSTGNYFTYSPLNFTDPEKITILFKGTYIPNGQSQCAWSIQSTTGNSLHLIFENNEVTLKYGNFTAFSFGNIAFSESTEISIYLIIRNTSYEFTMNYGKKVIQKTGNLDFTIPLSTFTSLTLGNASPLHANPWFGSINLNEFSIYNNGELLYTPSNGATWNFSNILISDGKIPLQDNSRATAGHIYSFPVTEIVQSGSTVLLTCQISEDSYLTIKEIGLYIQTPNGKLLFGSITNLNVNKEKNLAYNLVFTVNTTINVVNAIGFPADNGIIVEDPDFIEFKDFTTLKEVNTYILTNLERIIRMNAGAKGSYENSSVINNQAGIGHNRPQVIYRVQQDLEEKADCYNTIDTFLKLVNRFQEEIERQVDYDTFEIVGDLEVPLDGKIEGFSPTKYLTCSTPFLKTDSWEVNSSFTTKGETHGTVVALTNLNTTPPLELGVENNKCYLNIYGMESLSPTELSSYYLRDTYSDTVGPLKQWATPEQVGSVFWTALTYGNGKYVAVGENGYVANYTESIWSTPVQVLPPSVNSISWNAVTYGNEKFVAVGERGYFTTSEDGITWSTPSVTTSTTALETPNLYGITYANNKFVAVGAHNYIVTSTDGITWEACTSSSNLQWVGITYGDGKFVIVEKFGVASTSTNGTTWTSPTQVISNQTLSSVTYGNGNFITVGSSGNILTSTNGTTWSSVMSDSSLGNLNVIVFHNEKFTVGGDFGRILTSTSGAASSWLSDRAGNNSWRGIACHDNQTVIVGTHGSVTYYPAPTTFYGWERKSNTKCYNFHCNNLTLASSPLVTFPQQDITELDHDNANSSEFSISLRVLFDSINGTQYLIGCPTIEHASFEIYLEDGKLGANLYEASTKEPINESLRSRYTLKANRYYNITLSYYEGRYSLHYEMEPVGNEYPDEETIFVYSDEVVSLTENDDLLIGQKYFTAQFDPDLQQMVQPIKTFKGIIDFANFNLSFKNEIVWNGALELDKIFTLDRTPLSNDDLYDEDFYIITGATSENYINPPVINESNLFPIENNTKYTVNITYSENESTQKGTYTVKVITDDHRDTEQIVLNTEVNVTDNLSNRMNLPITTYIGNSSVISKAFSAVIDLIGWEIKQGEDLWIFDHDVALNDTQLIQCYRMPDLNKNQYSTKDLCNLNRKIRFLSNKFEGNDDVINFSYKEGLTLCIKVALQDAESKVLLYKSNLVNDIYFSLTFVNQELKFTMITKNGFASVSRQLTLEEYASYTNEPIMLTVILTPQYDDYYYLQMYKNNEAVTEEAYVQVDSSVDPAMFILSNYIEELPTYEVTTNGVQETETAEVNRFVKDLVVIKGAISPNELAYINSLFDTNY